MCAAALAIKPLPFHWPKWLLPVQSSTSRLPKHLLKQLPHPSKKPLQKRKCNPMKRILFIDRDGTLINEAPPTYQLDSFDKLVFYPKMFEFMGRIARELDYELVMVTNQDGLGLPTFPENTFWPVQNFVMKSLEN